MSHYTPSTIIKKKKKDRIKTIFFKKDFSIMQLHSTVHLLLLINNHFIESETIALDCF
jgi:hypothetical protein